MTLDEWEGLARAVPLAALTLAEMRALYDRCPDGPGSAVAQGLWRLIVAMVHTRRGPHDRPSAWTLSTLDQGVEREPVH